ncbi:hypothetical protein [Acidipropionibacterium jensenii]|uniref:hypothetical protein n=1 Tax=Acidipropionibacterium jensenii TaxID=1749 RepID=UPI001F3489DD|nr:hypothetical protein [Acidipropionibacterium jensenii]
MTTDRTVASRTSSALVKTRYPTSALTDPPVGERPQSKCSTMSLSQCHQRSRTGTLGSRL